MNVRISFLILSGEPHWIRMPKFPTGCTFKFKGALSSPEVLPVCSLVHSPHQLLPIFYILARLKLPRASPQTHSWLMILFLFG